MVVVAAVDAAAVDVAAAAAGGVLRTGGTVVGVEVAGAGGAGAGAGIGKLGRSQGTGKEVALQDSPCSLPRRHHHHRHLLRSPSGHSLLPPRERYTQCGI